MALGALAPPTTTARTHNLIKAFRRPKSRRRPEDCSDGAYTTPSGLNFTVQCGLNVAFYDIRKGGDPSNSVEDCMEQCAMSQPLCYAVAYDYALKKCFRKKREALDKSPKVNGPLHYAIAQQSQLESLETGCPLPDQSTFTTSVGMNFTIHCDRNDSADEPLLNGLAHPQARAETFEDCIEWCATSRPRCLGVVWNPDLEYGFNNCFPKASGDEEFLEVPNAAVHVALAVDIPPGNTSCTDTEEHKATNGKTFRIECSREIPGTIREAHHTSSLEECIDDCAEYKNDTGPACALALYDGTGVEGYQNCLLKSWELANKEPVPESAYALAVLTSNGTDGGSSTDTSRSAVDGSDEPVDNGRSKAWIGGAVVGTVAGIAVIVALVVFFLRKRRKVGGQKPATPHVELEGNPEQFQYYSYATKFEVDGERHFEVSAERETRELPVHERPTELHHSTR